MLINDVYPPIVSWSEVGNVGVLELEEKGVREWVEWEMEVRFTKTPHPPLCRLFYILTDVSFLFERR